MEGWPGYRAGNQVKFVYLFETGSPEAGLDGLPLLPSAGIAGVYRQA